MPSAAHCSATDAATTLPRIVHIRTRSPSPPTPPQSGGDGVVGRPLGSTPGVAHRGDARSVATLPAVGDAACSNLMCQCAEERPAQGPA
eukprot:6180096-Pleurochrysis_carterae.AAC.3